MAPVELTLILHPSGAAENVKKLSLPQVKNLARGGVRLREINSVVKRETAQTRINFSRIVKHM